ncbi:MAG: hypothetical protein Sv326_0556 [Candidatus Fermentimicrarchaeum limneticum]|uniref:Glycosyltransferase 2-like domain-containing protein n=1 Tax=Fermentimicrarchaeum limneticum TaxID=2795018 RepID=A0A7D5XCN7_FERL1|nr:MAG: hypothetical protein Sv326_0556 [Candidatus Fermentimicrarchaeum limneticum]
MDKFDIVVGIPTYNNSKTISFVVKQIDAGLRKHFPNRRALIVDSDARSNDGTMEVFEGTETKTEKLFVHYKNPISGKGSALKEIFELSIEKNSEFIAVFDSDLRSITPEWVRLMIKPIEVGADFTVPNYFRYKYDGTITNNICFPLIYGVLCRNIRQPIGGDFAFNRAMVEFWLGRTSWENDIARFGIDIFMTSNAVLGNFKVKQVFLGEKIHDPRNPTDLKPMFSQVVKTFFGIIASSKGEWFKLKEVGEVEMVGSRGDVEPQAFEVDVERMREDFLKGRREMAGRWKSILDARTFSLIHGMEEPEVDAELWCDIVFDFIAHSTGEGDWMNALIPLWSARNYSFVKETESMSSLEAEQQILEQARIFFGKRERLIEKLEPVMR